MKVKILILLLFFLVGCAHVCVTNYAGDIWCKHEVKSLPKEFPDELFEKWFVIPFEGVCLIVEKNGKCSLVAVIFFNQENKSTGTALTDVGLDGSLLIWGFIETIDGEATIAWKAKDINKWKIGFLDGCIETYNSGDENRF